MNSRSPTCSLEEQLAPFTAKLPLQALCVSLDLACSRLYLLATPGFCAGFRDMEDLNSPKGVGWDQLTKHFLNNHDYLCLIQRTHIRKPGVLMHTCNLRAGDERHVDLWATWIATLTRGSVSKEQVNDA